MGSRNRFENRNDSFSFAPPAGGSLSTEGRRAARRSAGTRRAILPVPASTPSSGSVTRMGGQEYNMSDPKQDTAYRTAQKAELDRQRGRSPMADIRGGGGLSDTGSRVARSTPAPRDPNNTGAKGTSMTYDIFRDDMRKLYENDEFEVRDTFQAAKLPGTPEQTEELKVDGGENQPSSDKNKAASAASKSSMASTPAANAVLEGAKLAKLEDERQLALDKVTRRDAFLNAKGGALGGLRAVEALQGLAYAKGQHYRRDSSVEGGLREIGQDEYRERRRGGIIPAAKAKAIARKEQSDATAQTAAYEAPSDVSNPFVIGEDNKTEIIDNSSAMHGARTGFNTDVKMPNWFGKGLNTDRQMFGL